MYYQGKEVQGIHHWGVENNFMTLREHMLIGSTSLDAQTADDWDKPEILIKQPARLAEVIAARQRYGAFTIYISAVVLDIKDVVMDFPSLNPQTGVGLSIPRVVGRDSEGVFVPFDPATCLDLTIKMYRNRVRFMQTDPKVISQVETFLANLDPELKLSVLRGLDSNQGP